MEAYLADQIMKGKLDYDKIVDRFPQYKTTIDDILTLAGYEF